VSIRTQRVAAEIQKALAGPLQRIAEELGVGLITVTEVRLSPDLQMARIYISIYGGKPTSVDVIEAIEKDYHGKLRHGLGRAVRLRYVPQLKFYIDDSLDRADRINSILDSVKPKDEEQE